MPSGLFKTEGDDVRIGVDSTSSGVAGRKSVRLESTATYNNGLFIAKFSHFPKPVCGAWPAFWMAVAGAAGFWRLPPRSLLFCCCPTPASMSTDGAGGSAAQDSSEAGLWC